MSFSVFMGGVEQGLVYALVALGIYVSYRILNIADLTTDGSFTLGAAVSAICTIAGHPVLGLVGAIVAGSMAGLVSAFLQTKLGVQPILAGIITMTALYSINLLVMGNRPNLPMLKNETVFTLSEGIFGSANKLIIILGIVVVVAALLIAFLQTQLGLSLRATGDNIDMVAASSINAKFTTAIGLVIANGIIGLAGAVLAQYQRSASCDLGNGKVVVGLACLIIGEVIMVKRGSKRGVIGSCVGGVVYWLLMTFAMTSSLVSATNLKLVSAIIVAVAISAPVITQKIKDKAKRKGSAKIA